MAMFDPQYVAEVFNDILGRRGLELVLAKKDKPEPPSVDARAAEQETKNHARRGNT